MVTATTLGFFQAGWVWVPVVGLLLTILPMPKYAALARQHMDIGAGRVVALSVGATFANNIAFATITFLAGRAFAWLIAG
jgi:hypothetical protein